MIMNPTSSQCRLISSLSIPPIPTNCFGGAQPAGFDQSCKMFKGIMALFCDLAFPSHTLRCYSQWLEPRDFGWD